MNSPAERAVCRALFRCCLEADRNPGLLVTLFGRPTRLYDWGEGKVLREPSSKHPFVDDAVWTANGGSTQYAHPDGSAVRAAREHYRRAKLLNLPYLADAKELLRRLQEACTDATTVGVVKKPKDVDPSSALEDTRQVPERLPKFVRFAPHDNKSIAAGDLLVSHPVSGIFQSIFDNSIILLTKVNRTAGSVEGLILNKSWHETFPGTNEFDAILDKKDLYFGGPVMGESGEESLVWLHSHGNAVSGSMQILPTVWSDGDLPALQKLAESDGKLTGLRLFLGRSAWALSQLEIELERGVWVRARADGLTVHDFCFGPTDSIGLWQSAMYSAGMPALAEFPRGGNTDKMLREIEDRFLEGLKKTQRT